jgi:hypothetical protein
MRRHWYATEVAAVLASAGPVGRRAVSTRMFAERIARTVSPSVSAAINLAAALTAACPRVLGIDRNQGFADWKHRRAQNSLRRRFFNTHLPGRRRVAVCFGAGGQVGYHLAGLCEWLNRHHAFPDGFGTVVGQLAHSLARSE